MRFRQSTDRHLPRPMAVEPVNLRWPRKPRGQLGRPGVQQQVSLGLPATQMPSWNQLPNHPSPTPSLSQHPSSERDSAGGERGSAEVSDRPGPASEAWARCLACASPVPGGEGDLPWWAVPISWNKDCELPGMATALSKYESVTVPGRHSRPCPAPP